MFDLYGLLVEMALPRRGLALPVALLIVMLLAEMVLILVNAGLYVLYLMGPSPGDHR